MVYRFRLEVMTGSNAIGVVVEVLAQAMRSLKFEKYRDCETT